jgi:hypothetical protein
LKHVAQHYNFTKSGIAIACWGETCIIDKYMRKSLNDKNIAVLLHYFERTLDDPIPSNLIFLPDHLYVRANGYQSLIKTLHESPLNKSMSERLPSVFWRGTSNGKIMNMIESDRYKMCLEAKNYSWIDVGITRTYSQYAKNLYIEKGIFRDYANEYEWVQHRGIIDIDGTISAWGLYWRLASGSIVFKVESTWTSQLIEKLVPWVHYIKLKSDFSDLGELTKIIANDKFTTLLETISNNAYDLMKEFTYENEINRIVAELNHFWES